MLLGVVTGVLLKFRGLEEERKKRKNREEELLLSYPQLVTTLALLIGAGNAGIQGMGENGGTL